MPLNLPFEAATAALDRALADGGLLAESRRAVTDGMDFVMQVGPRGGHFPTREVMVRVLAGRRLGERFVVPLRWETTGPAGHLFPALDANLEVAPGNRPGTSSLSIIGRYQPPLAIIGQTLDRALMSKVASATMSAMVHEIAAQLDHLSA